MPSPKVALLNMLSTHSFAHLLNAEQSHRVAHVPGKRSQKVSRNVPIYHPLIRAQCYCHVWRRHWLPSLQADMLLSAAYGQNASLHSHSRGFRTKALVLQPY